MRISFIGSGKAELYLNLWHWPKDPIQNRESHYIQAVYYVVYEQPWNGFITAEFLFISWVIFWSSLDWVRLSRSEILETSKAEGRHGTKIRPNRMKVINSLPSEEELLAIKRKKKVSHFVGFFNSPPLPPMHNLEDVFCWDLSYLWLIHFVWKFS